MATKSRSLSRPLAPLFAALAVVACTSYGGPINGQQALSPEEQRLQAVETKLADLTRRYNAAEANREQRGQEDLAALRGQVEQLRHDFDVSQRQNQQQYQSVDTRLTTLEAAAQSGATAADPGLPGAGGTAPAVNTPAGPAPVYSAAPPSAAADEEAAYLKSFDLLKAGKYDDAIRGFRGMLEKYPQGNYSDNAWYWTGESCYIKKDYPNALLAYRSLLEKFPASPKVPDALLKTGIILQEQNKNDQARAAYQRVIKEFPNSSSATQARGRLAQLH